MGAWLSNVFISFSFITRKMFTKTGVVIMFISWIVFNWSDKRFEIDFLPWKMIYRRKRDCINLLPINQYQDYLYIIYILKNKTTFINRLLHVFPFPSQTMIFILDELDWVKPAFPVGILLTFWNEPAFPWRLTFPDY